MFKRFENSEESLDIVNSFILGIRMKLGEKKNRTSNIFLSIYLCAVIGAVFVAPESSKQVAEKYFYLVSWVPAFDSLHGLSEFKTEFAVAALCSMMLLPLLIAGFITRLQPQNWILLPEKKRLSALVVALCMGLASIALLSIHSYSKTTYSRLGVYVRCISLSEGCLATVFPITLFMLLYVIFTSITIAIFFVIYRKTVIDT